MLQCKFKAKVWVTLTPLGPPPSPSAQGARSKLSPELSVPASAVVEMCLSPPPALPVPNNGPCWSGLCSACWLPSLTWDLPHSFTTMDLPGVTGWGPHPNFPSELDFGPASLPAMCLMIWTLRWPWLPSLAWPCLPCWVKMEMHSGQPDSCPAHRVIVLRCQTLIS